MFRITLSKIQIPIVFLLGLLVAAEGLASSNSDNEQPPHQLPIEVYDGYLVVVEGTIGTQHGLKFLLDTGATYTTIDRKLADSLNLALRPGKVINLDRTLALDRATLPIISYGPIFAENLSVFVADLSYFRSNGEKIDAIIGLDLLARQNFRIDFAHKQLLFEPFSPSRKAVPLLTSAVTLRVLVEIEGHRVSMIADSGLSGVLFYEDRLANLNADYRVLRETIGRSLGGAVPSKLAIVTRIRLNGQDLDRRIYLTSNPHSDSLRDVAGYLGLASLHAKEITFDFVRGELRWTP